MQMRKCGERLDPAGPGRGLKILAFTLSEMRGQWGVLSRIVTLTDLHLKWSVCSVETKLITSGHIRTREPRYKGYCTLEIQVWRPVKRSGLAIYIWDLSAYIWYLKPHSRKDPRKEWRQSQRVPGTDVWLTPDWEEQPAKESQESEAKDNKRV